MNYLEESRVRLENLEFDQMKDKSQFKRLNFGIGIHLGEIEL